MSCVVLPGIVLFFLVLFYTVLAVLQTKRTSKVYEQTYNLTITHLQ